MPSSPSSSGCWPSPPHSSRAPLVTGESILRRLISMICVIPVGIIMLIFCVFLALLLYHAFSGLVYYLPYTRKVLVGPMNPLRQAVSAANTVSQHRKD